MGLGADYQRRATPPIDLIVGKLAACVGCEGGATPVRKQVGGVCPCAHVLKRHAELRAHTRA
eukprot:CAMPEP_0174720352 /NCGR_PEP_ID=MMETSP1094-20130205/33375_1 /TAXON_ID=156173 /ORGANISM="Chrysochromulina brevifilum, Strain UTEX LB 985" /LENGTH=61 /DNA_ID=CAMNT_0015920819 /DNA_START=319 /DNA_END=504 /DNA_ORIENTATION=+